MSKSLRWLMVTIILVTQFVYPFQMIYAIDKKNDFSIQEVDVGNGLFNLVLENRVDYDEVRVEIPKEGDYNLFGVKHQIENNTTLIIEKKDITNNIIPIQLRNIRDNESRLSFKVYKDNVLVGDANYELKQQVNLNKIDEGPLQREQNDQSIYDNSNNVTSAPELQRFLSVIPLFDTVESGNDALYKIILKTTGSQVNYTNVQLVINLPSNKWTNFQQNLDDLAIANVVPLYDEENNQLVYDFDELKSGQTYETVIKIGTNNGYMKNKESLDILASLNFLDKEELSIIEKKGTVIIKSSNSVIISKTHTGTKTKGKPTVPMQESEVTWKIRVSVPNKSNGQMYLKEGTRIVIKDTLPNGLEYVSSSIDNNKPISTEQNGNVLTWAFEVPSTSTQSKSGKSLFDVDINVVTKIKKDSKLVGKELTNVATADVMFIDDQKILPIPKAESNITVYKSEGDTATIVGTVITPLHLGPVDTFGNITTAPIFNPNPIGDDSAYLGFRHGMRGAIYSKEMDLNKFSVVYTIDDHLYLDKLRLPSDEQWLLGRTKDEMQANKPLPVVPNYDMVISYVSNGKPYKKTIPKPETGVVLNLSDLGLKKGDRIKELEYKFKGKIPMGLANRELFTYYFTVEPGYAGEVKNKFNMIGESSYDHEKGRFSSVNTIPFNHKKDGHPQAVAVADDRTAQIEKVSNNQAPGARISINLLDEKQGVVDPGENRIKIKFEALPASPSALKEKLESVVLLPPGVSISENKNQKFFDNSGLEISGKFRIIDNNYNNTNRQLVKFEWDEKYIRRNQELSAEVNVNISSKAPNSLYFDVYGFSGNKSIRVPKTTENSITDTILQTDVDDLNRDGKTDHPRIKSSNVYHMINKFDLRTEKYVKNSNTDWSKFIEAKPSEVIDYRLYLTNSTGKDISSMTLIDVLPFNGDLGLTDNISRGSQFRPTLVGPVTLPTEWKNKVSVYYSEESQPTRDELYRYTADKDKFPMVGNLPEFKPAKWLGESAVSDWSKISSIKIELVPGTNWIPGVDMDIIYQMKMPSVDQIKNKKILDKTTNPLERAAWNSFAVATDQGQPVEPHQVGVYMNEDIGNLTINKIDSETKKALSGAEFKISNEDGSFKQTIISNEKGLAKLTNLPLGNYILEEVKAPDGYNLSEKKITFEVTNETYNHTITVENQKIKGKLTIKKVDSVTGKVLSGAVFEVRNSEGDIINTLTTDGKGVADVSDLLDDKYTITEVKAPEGYNILQKPIEFEITSKNSDIILTIKNTKTGWELPETGGSGMLLSSVIGLMFISVGLSFIRVRKIK